MGELLIAARQMASNVALNCCLRDEGELGSLKAIFENAYSHVYGAGQAIPEKISNACILCAALFRCAPKPVLPLCSQVHRLFHCLDLLRVL